MDSIILHSMQVRLTGL